MTEYASLGDTHGLIVRSTKEEMYLLDPSLPSRKELPLVSAYPTAGWFVPGDSIADLDARYGPFIELSEHDVANAFEELRTVWPTFGRNGDSPDR